MLTQEQAAAYAEATDGCRPPHSGQERYSSSVVVFSCSWCSIKFASR